MTSIGALPASGRSTGDPVGKAQLPVHPTCSIFPRHRGQCGERALTPGDAFVIRREPAQPVVSCPEQGLKVLVLVWAGQGMDTAAARYAPGLRSVTTLPQAGALRVLLEELWTAAQKDYHGTGPA